MTEDTLWHDARKRMFIYVDALLLQEFGIQGEEQRHYADWILDRIFKAEFYGALDAPVWAVMRQDDNGNHFTIEKHIHRSRAQEIKNLLEERGHKQFYWIEPCADN